MRHDDRLLVADGQFDAAFDDEDILLCAGRLRVGLLAVLAGDAHFVEFGAPVSLDRKQRARGEAAVAGD